MNSQVLRSIERLNAEELFSGGGSQSTTPMQDGSDEASLSWELIVVFELPACSLPVMVPIGEDEILIAGGTHGNNDCLMDGFLFHAGERTAMRCFEGDFRFSSESGLCYSTTKDGSSIVAMIEDSNFMLKLVTYKKGDAKLKVVH